MRTRSADCVSDLQLDARSAGELEQQVVDAIDAHVTGCARCSERAARVAQARAAFLAVGPAFSRTRRAPRSWLRPLVAGAAVAAALALALLPNGLPTEPALRSKGDAHISVFIKRGTKVWRGTSGARVCPGDQLRFTYTTDVERYLVIVSVDARGKRSLYFPDAERAARLERASDRALPSSVVLDEVLGPERVIALFCAQPIAVAPLLAEDERAWSAPQGCKTSELRLVKEPPPP